MVHEAGRLNSEMQSHCDGLPLEGQTTQYLLSSSGWVPLQSQGGAAKLKGFWRTAGVQYTVEGWKHWF